MPRRVEPEGPTTAKIAFVGEAPGADEDRHGKPFVGSSGKLLNRLMASAGIMRHACYVTNVVKERPPKNNIKKFVDLSRKNVKETPEYLQYLEELKRELENTSANVIVAVGSVSLYALTGQKSIMKYRGSILESTLLPGRKVIGIVHPAAALRKYLLSYSIMADLTKVKEESEYPDIRRTERELLIPVSYTEAMNFLEECSKEKELAFDIEVMRGEISCLSFAITPQRCMSIPFTNCGEDIYTPDEEYELWLRIASLLENNSITIVGQNIMFDASFVFQKMGILTTRVEDTMVGFHILYPDLPKGLDYLTSVFTKETYYKDEGKNHMKYGTSEEEFWIYNAKDSAVTLECWYSIKNQLKEQGNWTAYKSQMSAFYPCLYMFARGIKMADADLRKEKADTLATLDSLKEELNEVAGMEINPDSPKQLMDYFYIRKGIKPYVNRKSGNPTADDTALKRLENRGYKEASILREYRKHKKLYSTYYCANLDDDGRMRGAFNLAGTVSGRLSSSKTIFGTGLNMQNIPPAMKRFLVADEGYVVYDIDLSQVENRLVAYIAPDRRMIDAFERGIDIHSQTAALILNKPIEEVSREDGSCSYGNGQHSERYWGKTTNHALNYDMGYKSFAFNYQVNEREAKKIVEAYHRAYPGVRAYHRWVKHQLNENRTLTNLFGKKRKFLDRWGDSLFKSAYDWIPQSTGTEIINRWGLQYCYTNPEMPELELLNVVHDSVVFQLPLSIGLEKHARYCMRIRKNLEQELTWKGRNFRIPADIKVGSNLKDMVELRRCSTIEELSGEIEAAFSTLTEKHEEEEATRLGE